MPDGGISQDALRTYGERVTELLRASGVVQLIVGGSGPARTIVEKASEFGVDLVVLGRHGAGSVSRKGDDPLGSVPLRVLRDVNCCVLVVPKGSSQGEAAQA